MPLLPVVFVDSLRTLLSLWPILLASTDHPLIPSESLDLHPSSNRQGIRRLQRVDVRNSSSFGQPRCGFRAPRWDLAAWSESFTRVLKLMISFHLARFSLYCLVRRHWAMELPLRNILTSSRFLWSIPLQLHPGTLYYVQYKLGRELEMCVILLRPFVLSVAMKPVRPWLHPGTITTSSLSLA
jgi:hypothetical protein